MSWRHAVAILLGFSVALSVAAALAEPPYAGLWFASVCTAAFAVLITVIATMPRNQQ